MSGTWRHLPAAPRAIAVAASEAVAAARVRDPAALDEAAARLGALDREQVGLVLGAVVRNLLEESHRDGLTGDDVRAVLEDSVRNAAAWLPDVDPNVLVILLTGALGVHEPDPQQPPVSAVTLARHAPLLVVELLAGADRSFVAHLEGAFSEIARHEAIDL